MQFPKAVINPMCGPKACKPQSGFTLIELSIVLVIIALIVGGVLIGRDLIAVAETRAQIRQIEEYNTAVRVFQGKYNCTPGDCTSQQAAQFGFFPRTGATDDGDGNGVVNPCGGVSGIGCENLFFWTDLSAANLIGGSFTNNTDGVLITATTQAEIAALVPGAAIGHGNFVTIFGNPLIDDSGSGLYGVQNNFSVSALTNVTPGNTSGAPAMTPIQAFSIDSKIDDGLPMSGIVLAAWMYNFSMAAYLTTFGTIHPSAACIQGNPPYIYNTLPGAGNVRTCSLMIQAEFGN